VDSTFSQKLCLQVDCLLIRGSQFGEFCVLRQIAVSRKTYSAGEVSYGRSSLRRANAEGGGGEDSIRQDTGK